MMSPLGVGRVFEAVNTACPAHPQWPWDGSFWIPWDAPYCEQLPEEVLKWEILQLAAALESGYLDKFLEP